MKQYLDSNSKIKYFLLSTIFSILFIFTALYNPIVAHAEGEGLGSVPNGSGVNAQEVDSTSTAGNLFWAASGDRTGIMVYIVDDAGEVKAPMHGQTQAFWSADKRNGREAVENRTA